MGFFDFIKRKELNEIAELKSRVTQLASDNKDLSRFREVSDLDKHIQNQQITLDGIRQSYNDARNELSEVNREIQNKRAEIVELDNTILLQEYGMYSPVYDFANSEQYADKLREIRDKQKQMILAGTAATCLTTWTVMNSEAKGRQMVKQNIKQILRCFNDECDVLVGKVKFNNVEAFVKKIHSSFDALNKMNSSLFISISEAYAQLKVEELVLAYEYALAKQREKEEQRELREQQREEARLAKEIEEKRKEIEKEQKHYANALVKINNQLASCTEEERVIVEEKKRDIEAHLRDLNVAIQDIDYREANKKAGYVYIISNIGAFGENVYKIGMTRRLDPTERVDELGDASVPFKFDIHALIFSDDAPKLEAALHRAFETKRLNKVNARREFFAVTLDEIMQVVKENYDKTVDFKRMPEAEQYRQSIRII